MLCLVQLICNWFINITHIIFPAPILGIIFLFVLLQFNIIKKDWIRDICNLLLKYMPLFFIPVAVGVISYYKLIEENLVLILTNVIVTMVVTLIVTAIFVENIIKYIRLRKIRKYRDG